MNKAITKPYDYFGRQCTCCGSYFTYTFIEAIRGPACPTCHRQYSHSLEDPTIDVEPDAKEIKVQRQLRSASRETVMIPQFSIAQKVCVIYRENQQSSWQYFGVANVQGISCTITQDQEKYVYTLDRPVAFHSSSYMTTQDGIVEIYDGPKNANMLLKLDARQQSLLPSPKEFDED